MTRNYNVNYRSVKCKEYLKPVLDLNLDLDLVIRFLIWSHYPDASFSICTKSDILIILSNLDLGYI